MKEDDYAPFHIILIRLLIIFILVALFNPFSMLIFMCYLSEK